MKLSEQVMQAAADIPVAAIARKAKMRRATVHDALRNGADIKISTAQRIINACEELRNEKISDPNP